MFWNKNNKKLDAIAEEVIKRIDEREKLRKWREFFNAHKVGYILSYKDLEWECVATRTDTTYEYVSYLYITLKIGNQIRPTTIFEDTPEEIDFVYE